MLINFLFYFKEKCNKIIHIFLKDISKNFALFENIKDKRINELEDDNLEKELNLIIKEFPIKDTIELKDIKNGIFL
jgi:hypothetical protein